MASLLDRLGVSPVQSTSSVGPVRSKSTSRSSPYARPPRGDVNSTWSHDLYQLDSTSPSSQPSLSARLSLSGASTQAPRANLNTIAQKALRDATTPGTGLSIKGASQGVTSGNVVQVEGLVGGTSPADVEAIFKHCGAILTTRPAPVSPSDGGVAIRVTYKSPVSAQAAVKKFHGKPADGRTLSVQIVGVTGASLAGRLGGGGGGMDIVKEAGSVDVLMDGGAEGGSKMRSDALLTDHRSQVLLAPPGADPKDYVPSAPSRRGRGGGRGGRGRRGRGRGMDID